MAFAVFTGAGLNHQRFATLSFAAAHKKKLRPLAQTQEKGACGLLSGGVREPCGRFWLPYAYGNREFLRVFFGLAEMYVSSGKSPVMIGV